MLLFFVCVLGIVKWSVVFINMKFDNLEMEIGNVIVEVVFEVVDGKFNDYFFLVVW